MDETKMRVIFPKDNNILYGQDFSCHRGVPSGVEFEAEESGDYYMLTAPGYGISGNYGNGALYVYKDSKLNINDFKVKSEVDVLRACIAELEEDKRSLRDSNLWLKQNYEDLERDYGVMHEKMCARIDKLKGAIKIRDARIAELETFCKELFFEGTYLSMLNGLVRNDSDWHFLTEKYEEMFGKESEK